jgi:hypothetical protein
VAFGNEALKSERLVDVVTFVAIIAAMILIARGFGIGWAIGAAAFLTRLAFRKLTVRKSRS